MILLPLVLSACYFWVIRSKYSSWRVALLAFLAILCLYVPGGAWLVLFGAVYAHLALAGLHKRTPKMVKVAIYLMMLVSIAPLVYALARHPAQLHGLFLIPTSFPGIVEVLKNVAWMAAGLVWHTGSSSDYQIGQLGLLSLTQFTLAAFGLYAMWARARAKSYAFLGLIIFGVLAAGLNNIYPLLLISLIGVSVFVAAGLRFLLLEWQTVFPRNPLPRGLAIVLFCSLMAMQAVYGIRYSLVAWPHTDQVRQTYVIK